MAALNPRQPAIEDEWCDFASRRIGFFNKARDGFLGIGKFLKLEFGVLIGFGFRAPRTVKPSLPIRMVFEMALQVRE